MRRRRRKLRVPKRPLAAVVAALAAVALGAAAAQRPPVLRPASDAAAVARLRAHAVFLADDLLAGRLAGSRGHEIAARYVAAQLQQLGLAAPTSAGYLLPVPLVTATVDAASATLEVAGDGGRATLPWGAAWVAPASATQPRREVEAPVVYLGYGLSLPEEGWDDYAGRDVRGKVVLAALGTPATLDARAAAGGVMVRARAAAAHGAVGLLTFARGASGEGEGWERVRRVALAGVTQRTDGSSGPAIGAAPAGPPRARLSAVGLDVLLAAAGVARRDLEPALERPGKAIALPVRARLAYGSTQRRFTSPNVAGLLRGSDPRLAREVVVISAHLDHVGTGAAVGGDTIYNGFYDNAMGCALLLELGRAFAGARPAPRRSLLLVATTAEEEGLLGAEELAAHPPPVGRLVADVNLDMPLFLHAPRDLAVYGAGHSTLGEAARQGARDAGLAVQLDPSPEREIFTRSDQLAFATAGVPALYLAPAGRSADPTVDGLAEIDAFLATDYHQPSDDASLHVDWPSALRFLAGTVAIVQRIADAPATPQWRRGDAFAPRAPRTAPQPPRGALRLRKLQR